jgi:hypothetical protein
MTEPEPTHEEYVGWRQAVFGDPYLVWHDGPTFYNLIDEARSDVDSVVRMLQRGVQESDELAAQAFAELAKEGLAPADAADVLRAAADIAEGSVLVRLAQTLYVITGDPAWGSRIAPVVTNGGFWTDRMDAAIALADFPPTAELIEALKAGVSDRESLVRSHSADTLLRYAGHQGLVEGYVNVYDYDEYAERIASPGMDQPVTDEVRAGWRSVAEELAALIPLDRR